MKEIGSEFWSIDVSKSIDNELQFLNIGKDYKLLMSGSTAIDYVLHEINDTKKIVYMPDYCCESVIKPFIDNGYTIKYFSANVTNNKYDIDLEADCSIFYAMSYFGYNSSNMDNYIEKFRNRNIVSIEDITHRILCETNHCNKSTYLVASLRKWFPILSGGIAVNLNSTFKNDIDNYNVNEEFVEIKEKAMNLKKDYMFGNNINKEDFLDLFNKSNHMIEDYKNMKIDNKSIDILKRLDIENIKKTRIANCKIIEKKLKNIESIKLLYKYSGGDCPLFVPILLKNRDSIRKKLIVNNIYLPVHWPNNFNLENDIYDLELSLINDQRYDEKEIKEYIDKLLEIMGSDNSEI